MINALSVQQEDKIKIQAISQRVGQLRNELKILEKIIKKMLDNKRLTEEEQDSIDLMVAVREDNTKGWVDWNNFKKNLDIKF